MNFKNALKKGERKMISDGSGTYGCVVVEYRVEDVPKGWYKYEMRHADNNWSRPISVEHHVACNFWGTLLTQWELHIGNQGYLPLRGKRLSAMSPRDKHRVSRRVCPHCLRTFSNFSISFNEELGIFEATCPECGEKVWTPVPKGRFVLAFVDDSDPERDHELFTDDYRGKELAVYLVAQTGKEFIEKWAAICNHNVADNGMWYWCLDMKDPEHSVCFTSGACDPGDIEFFAEHPGLKQAAKAYMKKTGYVV